ncbi:MAG: NADH-quinone oxidoreductase subunit A [Candidatus Eisenbacteria bacterium]
MDIQVQSYLPAGVAIALALGFCGLFTFVAIYVGPKHSTPEKLAPFECGSEPIGSPRGRYSVKFYQIAILFLVFDIEAAFMYPWAVLYRDLSTVPGMQGGASVSFFGFGEMLVFVSILVVALAYVWRKKAIGWD